MATVAGGSPRQTLRCRRRSDGGGGGRASGARRRRVPAVANSYPASTPRDVLLRVQRVQFPERGGRSWLLGLGEQVDFDEIGAALDLKQRSAALTPFVATRRRSSFQGDGDAFALSSGMISAARLWAAKVGLADSGFAGGAPGQITVFSWVMSLPQAGRAASVSAPACRRSGATGRRCAAPRSTLPTQSCAGAMRCLELAPPSAVLP